MGTKKKIAILLHEKDRYPKTGGHFIWSLCELWRCAGVEVEVLWGVGKQADCDVVVAHLDVTVVPQAYRDFLARCPRAVNRDCPDISKRRISPNLLSRGDSYDGPVIVKTDRNCGGANDLTFDGRKVFFSPTKKQTLWRTVFYRTRISSDWARVNCISSEDYPIFEKLQDVPNEVFANPALVVERFLPEMEEGRYYHFRTYIFLGDRAHCSRMRSLRPVIKHPYAILREEVAIPDEIVAIRQDLGLDYGKLDFVIRDGRVVLLDVNRTPGVVGVKTDRRSFASQVAPGIESFLH